MMQPPPSRRRASTEARLTYQVPITLVLKMRCQISSVAPARSAWGTTWVHPALLTSTSSRPQRSTAAATSATACDSSDTSACT